MRKVSLVLLLLVAMSVPSLCALKWGAGVLSNYGTSSLVAMATRAKLVLDNKFDFTLGMVINNDDSNTNETDIIVNGFLRQKWSGSLNTYWKIGGGITLMSGKASGASYSGNVLSFMVGVEHYITDIFSVEFVSAPFALSSLSITGMPSINGQRMMYGFVGATLYL
jgi:hypothetical protein